MEKINTTNNVNSNKNNVNIKDFLAKQKVICNALEKLDEELIKMKALPFSVNIIDDFALIEEPIVFKNNGEDNNEKKERLKSLIKEIGNEYNLENDWLNNDLSIVDKNLKDLELFTGKLTFHTKMNLSIIVVNTLNFTDTIRMKIINLDTIIDKYKVIYDMYKAEEENSAEEDEEVERIDNSKNIEENYKKFENSKKTLIYEILDFMEYENFDMNNLDKYLKKYTVNPEYIYNTIMKYYKDKN